jgi:hypothetical protein
MRHKRIEKRNERKWLSKFFSRLLAGFFSAIIDVGTVTEEEATSLLFQKSDEIICLPKLVADHQKTMTLVTEKQANRLIGHTTNQATKQTIGGKVLSDALRHYFSNAGREAVPKKGTAINGLGKNLSSCLAVSL